MANIKSAIKRVKITEAKTLKNKMAKTRVKTTIKKFETAVNSGNLDEAKKLYPETTRVIDQAASKGVIHKNAAARQKSRLQLKLNTASK
ncbi:MAG TPA: 30S ribosomal protein S20 [Clostridiaceae bacterium]|nr:30S ribosomal protein S20 [Clostridiaceae bacterium]